MQPSATRSASSLCTRTIRGTTTRTEQHHAYDHPERRDPDGRRPRPDPARPASADGIGVSDPQDLDHGVDLRSVEVEHGARNVVVTTTHTDLRGVLPQSGSSGSVFLDTDPTDPGPEYVFAGGYFVGTDYDAAPAPTASPIELWGEPVEGSYRMRIDYDTDQVRMRISREALGSPDEVRVAVRVAGTRPDGRNTRTRLARRAAQLHRLGGPVGRYLTSRTSCGHPQPSAILAAHSRASSIVATSMIGDAAEVLGHLGVGAVGDHHRPAGAVGAEGQRHVLDETAGEHQDAWPPPCRATTSVDGLTRVWYHSAGWSPTHCCMK